MGAVHKLAAGNQQRRHPGAARDAGPVQRLSLRYEQARRSLVAEVCACAADPSQLAGVVAFTPRFHATPILEFAFTDQPVAAWTHRAMARLAGVNLRPPQRAGAITRLVVAEPTLARARVTFSGNGWHFELEGACADRGLVRGAIAAGGFLTSSGLVVLAADPAIPALAGALERIGVPHDVQANAISIPPAAAAAALMQLGLSGTARAYGAVLKASAAWADINDADRLLAQVARDRRHAGEQAAGAPVLEATRIAALGDLATRNLAPKYRKVAERLITDSNRSHADIAASIGISAEMLQQRIAKFWILTGQRTTAPGCVQAPPDSAHNAARARLAASLDARRIAQLGDLNQYKGLSEELRQCAQLRCAHPELSLGELAERLGMTKNVFAGRMRRFWSVIDKTG
ncbi:helix-turn-helix domain-containing protein [Mycobacterium sp. 134]|uniref:helix-turn-helix domain-containing protein n=1 Tax=Mycobacterium sp. 134 TaxID=3400425 RepID=UPI003AAABE48